MSEKNLETTIDSKVEAIIVTLEYIKRDITDIKSDIKEQKSQYVSKLEIDDVRKSLESFITKDQFLPYKVTLGLAGLAIVAMLQDLVRKYFGL